MLGRHCVNDAVKGVGNSLRTCAIKVRYPSLPKKAISSDSVATMVERICLQHKTVWVCSREQSSSKARTDSWASSLETTKWSAPRVLRASFSFLGDVLITVTSMPKPVPMPWPGQSKTKFHSDPGYNSSANTTGSNEGCALKSSAQLCYSTREFSLARGVGGRVHP